MNEPRILAIMGSGETAPAMAKVHRALFERLSGDGQGGSGSGVSVPATLIDTSYGFQENADDISARIVDYFRVSVGRPMTVASYRSRDVGAADAATAVARIREASYVLAGPGSPSYALRHWTGGPIPEALSAKLAHGGVVTMASAAALTLGVVTIPVYEIYKVGAEPSWLDGLDILGRATGLRAAVVPHYDNAEGGNHDTRFCYMGERRLRILERALPDGAFVLGVDGHTALILDLARGTARVSGLGGVTVRVNGRSVVFPSGTDTTIDALAVAARDAAAGFTVEAAAGWAGEPVPSTDEDRVDGIGRQLGRPGGQAPHREGSLRDAVSQLEGAFVEALVARDAQAAVATLLDLDSAIEARLRTGEDSPDLDNAGATFRALLVRLGDLAVDGTRDPRAALDPFVETLLELRARARAAHDWGAADLIRDRLAAAGVEVRDDAKGSTWVLRAPADQ